MRPSRLCPIITHPSILLTIPVAFILNPPSDCFSIFQSSICRISICESEENIHIQEVPLSLKIFKKQASILSFNGYDHGKHAFLFPYFFHCTGKFRKALRRVVGHGNGVIDRIIIHGTRQGFQNRFRQCHRIARFYKSRPFHAKFHFPRHYDHLISFICHHTIFPH